MDILTSLGVVPEFVFYHFLLFLVVFVFLTQVLFKPYLKAYNKRAERTVGNEDHAERLIAEAEELHLEYEKKAREVNQDHKSIYDDHRLEALREHDRVVKAAKEKAELQLNEAKGKIQAEVNKARKELSDQVPEISQYIVNQVAGKELIQ